jgi:hypothetical protein
LQEEGIKVVLSGGSAVSFYSSNKYVSKDLDLINTNFAKRRDIKSTMEKIGFREQGRYFIHPDTEYFVEFPDGINEEIVSPHLGARNDIRKRNHARL